MCSIRFRVTPTLQGEVRRAAALVARRYRSVAPSGRFELPIPGLGNRSAPQAIRGIRAARALCVAVSCAQHGPPLWSVWIRGGYSPIGLREPFGAGCRSIDHVPRTRHQSLTSIEETQSASPICAARYSQGVPDESLNLILETAFFGNRLVRWIEGELGQRVLGNQATLVLCSLALKGDQRVGDLATQTGVTSPRISQLTNELTEAGFVQIIRDPVDGRGRLLSLTTDGRSYIRSVGDGIQLAMEKESDHVAHYRDVLSDFLAVYLE